MAVSRSDSEVSLTVILISDCNSALLTMPVLRAAFTKVENKGYLKS